MIQRNERLSRAMKGGDTSTPDDEAAKSNENQAESKSGPACESDSASKEKEETALPTIKSMNDDPLKSLDLQLVEWNQKLVSENKNLHQVRTCLLMHSCVTFLRPDGQILSFKIFMSLLKLFLHTQDKLTIYTITSNKLYKMFQNVVTFGTLRFYSLGLFSWGQEHWGPQQRL